MTTHAIKFQFVCPLDVSGTLAARSVTPPDSDHRAAVVQGSNLPDFTITGLDSDFLTLGAKGGNAATQLEHAFRHHFAWGVVSGDEGQS